MNNEAQQAKPEPKERRSPIKRKSETKIQERYPVPFVPKEDGLWITREEKNGHISSKKLCNFLPYLVAEVTRNGGEKLQTAFRIGGLDEHGKHLPQIDLEVEEFLRMQWSLKRWGAGAIIEVGRTNAEYIRNAIQGTAPYHRGALPHE